MIRTALKRKTPLRARSGFKRTEGELRTHSTMKRTSMKRVGTVGKANRQARNAIASIAACNDMRRCEIGLDRCLGTWPLAPAHRHKRAWYKGDAALLADPRQWVCACQHCHDAIEFDAELTEHTFMRLRGAE